MPGIEAGSTWRQMTCHFVAPSARPPCLIEAGTERIASREEMITVGQHDEREDDARPASSTRPIPTGPADDEREPEDAVDDRGHRGEVLDVQLEQAVVPALLARVLLEVDRRRDADRHRHREQQDREVDRRQDRGPRAGLLRQRRRRVGEQLARRAPGSRR